MSCKCTGWSCLWLWQPPGPAGVLCLEELWQELMGCSWGVSAAVWDVAGKDLPPQPALSSFRAKSSIAQQLPRWLVQVPPCRALPTRAWVSSSGACIQTSVAGETRPGAALEATGVHRTGLLHAAEQASIPSQAL